jgi:hypothetical protein
LVVADWISVVFTGQNARLEDTGRGRLGDRAGLKMTAVKG